MPPRRSSTSRNSCAIPTGSTGTCQGVIGTVGTQHNLLLPSTLSALNLVQQAHPPPPRAPTLSNEGKPHLLKSAKLLAVAAISASAARKRAPILACSPCSRSLAFVAAFCASSSARRPFAARSTRAPSSSHRRSCGRKRAFGLPV